MTNDPTPPGPSDEAVLEPELLYASDDSQEQAHNTRRLAAWARDRVFALCALAALTGASAGAWMEHLFDLKQESATSDTAVTVNVISSLHPSGASAAILQLFVYNSSRFKVDVHAIQPADNMPFKLDPSQATFSIAPKSGTVSLVRITVDCTAAKGYTGPYFVLLNTAANKLEERTTLTDTAGQIKEATSTSCTGL